MKRLSIVFALAVAMPCFAQVINPFNGAAAPIAAPSASGPSAAGYFNDLFNNVGVGAFNVGSPSGQTNNTVDNNTTFNSLGVWQQSTGTVNGAGVQALFTGTAGRPLVGLNTGVWYWERRIQIQTLPGTTASAHEEGLINTFGSAPPAAAQAATFYLSSANGVPNDWYCKTAGGSIDTGTAATTSFVRLSMYADGTNLHFYINGSEITACKVAQSGITNSNFYDASTSVSLTTSSVTKLIDYTSFYAAVSR